MKDDSVPEDNKQHPRMSYIELMSVIPKMSTERILQLVALLKLELHMRGYYKKDEGH